MDIAVGMHQHQGAREYQQDTMSIKSFGSIGVLGILADGMGGHVGGEIASRLVSENFREFTIEREDIGAALQKYLLQGNEAIRTYKQTHPEVKSMGTTAIAFFMAPKRCQWVSVGDSPLYLIRNQSTITRINQNHSIAELLDLQAKAGEITQAEALTSSRRHMLTSAITGDEISQIDISAPWAVGKHDIYILASDGIETISMERIREIVLRHTAEITQEGLQKTAEALVEAVVSKRLRNQDNVTVIVLAKMHDDENVTASYRSTIVKKPTKNPLTLGMVAFVVLLLVAMVLFLSMGGDEDAVPSDTNMNTAVSEPERNVAVNKATPKPAKKPKMADNTDIRKPNKTVNKTITESKQTKQKTKPPKQKATKTITEENPKVQPVIKPIPPKKVPVEKLKVEGEKQTDKKKESTKVEPTHTKASIPTTKKPTDPQRKSVKLSNSGVGSSVREQKIADLENKFLEKARQDNEAAQNRLALGYRDHGHYDDAIHWYNRAIKLGSLVSLVQFGYMCERGWGMSKDIPRAKSYYKKALRNGYKKAQESLDALNQKHRDKGSP